ncbi:MAG: bifunctional folylpolyglutamate synthase/dihydrofolate synthase, partial [Candidatus Pelagibacter sp.]
MKLQQILSRFQKLHPKEIDLSLDRIKNLCKKLGNPQDNIQAISVVGTNGKNSTINAIFSILKEANFKCNAYISPHILKINERFIFNNKELGDDELADLFNEIENINNNEPITFFEILTACYFYKAAQFPDNINLIEAGLFHRFDATNILKENLASVVTSISKDHLDWLEKDQQTIEKIVFEKTSTLLKSKIIVAKQSSKKTMDCIKKTIYQNPSNKFFFNDDFSYSIGENDFFYYEDKLGGLKLPMPNILGQFQLENISTAIATLRNLDLGIKDEHIKRGITRISSLARLQEIKSGKLKELVKNNKLIIDGTHNEDGARVLNEYLQSLNCNKHIIISMMANKE